MVDDVRKDEFVEEYDAKERTKNNGQCYTTVRRGNLMRLETKQKVNGYR